MGEAPSTCYAQCCAAPLSRLLGMGAGGQMPANSDVDRILRDKDGYNLVT